MFGKRNTIITTVASCLAIAFSAASVVTAADVSQEINKYSNESIVLAYSKKDTDEHHDSHEEMHSDHGDKNHGKCSKMSKIDLNADGKINRIEFMKHHGAMFDNSDKNGDGFLDKDEMRSMMKKMHNKHGQDYKRKHDGDKEHGHSHDG